MYISKMTDKSKFLECVMNFIEITSKLNLNDTSFKMINNIYDTYGGFNAEIDNEAYVMYFKFLGEFRKNHEHFIYEIFSDELFEDNVSHEVNIAQLLYLMAGDLYICL